MREDVRESLGSLQRVGDRDGDALPLAGLGVELAASGGGEAIVLGATIVLRGAPGGAEPAGFFHAVERWEERAWLHLERAAGDLFDTSRDAEPVQLAKGERLEDQKVERALEEVGARVRHRRLRIV